MVIPIRYLTACQIDFPATMGQYNEVRGDVRFLPIGIPGPLVIGDCNRFEDGARIFVGPGGASLGDYNVMHRDTTIIGGGEFSMGHNCWIGQGAWLDCTGGLSVGNGVTVGLNCHVWSHLARGEQIEGWPFVKRRVRIDDDAWLVGDGVHVASGVHVGARSVALAGASVSGDMEADGVYAGVPARKIELRLRREMTLDEKMGMMWRWAREFEPTARQHGNHIIICRGTEEVRIGPGPILLREHWFTYFDMATKTYIKLLTPLEREFVAFLREGNKARFLPC